MQVIVKEILRKATKAKAKKRLRNLFSHFHQSGLPYSHLEKILKTNVATHESVALLCQGGVCVQ
jgi:site-specific recombinase